LDNTVEFKLPNTSERSIYFIFAALIVFFGLYSSFFTINTDEFGVVLRLGKYNRVVNPGLNFKIPFGIESIYKVPVQRQLKEEFGFRTVRAGVRTRYSQSGFLDESLMLTGDLNIGEVEWIVQFRIKNPKLFLFHVRNAIDTFRDMNEAIMREVVGDRTINEVLNIRREVELTVSNQLQELSDQYELGLNVQQIQLQDVTPPDAVKPAFNEVNEAQKEKEKLINQAQAEFNRVIPRARGEAERMIEEAKGYALERVNNARGDVANFKAVFKEYQKAPEVTRQRLYLETMNGVLARVGTKLITDQDAKGILPLFQWGQEKMSSGAKK